MTTRDPSLEESKRRGDRNPAWTGTGWERTRTAECRRTGRGDRDRSAERRRQSGEGTERADSGERAGAGSGPGAEDQARRLQGPGADAALAGKGPGAAARRLRAGRGRAAASGALRTSRSEPGAGRGPGRALTVRSGAPRSSRCHRPRPRRAPPPQQQAAPPRPPRSILAPTRAPQPRATAPPPKMASPAPRPPHNAARRDVTRPRAAGRGSGGKLRPGWSAIPAPCGNLAAAGGRPRPGSLTRRAWRDGGGEGCPAAGPAPPRLAAGHRSRPPARPEGQACQLRLLLGLAQPPGTPAAGLTQQPAGGHAESVARPSLRAAAWELSRCRQTSPERRGGIAKG